MALATRLRYCGWFSVLSGEDTLPRGHRRHRVVEQPPVSVEVALNRIRYETDASVAKDELPTAGMKAGVAVSITSVV